MTDQKPQNVESNDNKDSRSVPFGFDQETSLGERDTIRKMFDDLTGPRRRTHTSGTMQELQYDDDEVYDIHPVFPLAEHFRSNDEGNPGYTENPYRGDHLSIPCFSEEGEPSVLDVSFHKGQFIVEQVTFPHVRHKPVGELLNDMLKRYETR